MIRFKNPKLKNTLRLFIVILLFILNCREQNKSNIYDFIEDGIDIDIIKSKNIEKELIEEFGIPISFEEEIKESQYLNTKSIFKILKFNGIIFEIVNSIKQNQDREFIHGITVYDNRIILKYGVKIGDNLDFVIKKFGKPNLQESIEDSSNGDRIERWIYSNSNKSVTFYCKNDRVIKIIWKYNLV